MNILTNWNNIHRPQPFGSTTGHMCCAEHFDHPQFLELVKEMGEHFNIHRKLWEFASIAKVVKDHFHSLQGKQGIGFGVGTEPLTSLFAKWGGSILATDQPHGQGSVNWQAFTQHATSLEAIHRRDVIDSESFSSLVKFQHIDMNNLPTGLGTFDLMWSSCVIEHIGGFANAKEFLTKSYHLLNPGGLAIHTTEIELTKKPQMMVYGHDCVFRTDELIDMEHALRSLGAHLSMSFYTPVEHPYDVHVSTPPYDPAKPHLKLLLGESITTSFMLVIRKPR